MADAAAPAPPVSKGEEDPPQHALALTLVLSRAPYAAAARAACACRAWRAAARGRLTALRLQNEQRGGAALDALCACAPPPPIATADLEFAQGVTNERVEALTAACGATLTALNLNACQAVGDPAVSAAVRNCPALESLSLYWDVRVTDAALDSIASAHCASRLRTLNLSGCKKVTDRGVRAVADACGAITALDLTRNPNVSAAGLRAVVDGMPYLEDLRLYACPGLRSFAPLADLSRLAVLDLCGAQHLCDAELAAAVAANPGLVTLNCTWCVQLTDEAAIAIGESCHEVSATQEKAPSPPRADTSSSGTRAQRRGA